MEGLLELVAKFFGSDPDSGPPVQDKSDTCSFCEESAASNICSGTRLHTCRNPICDDCVQNTRCWDCHARQFEEAVEAAEAEAAEAEAETAAEVAEKEWSELLWLLDET